MEYIHMLENKVIRDKFCWSILAVDCAKKINPNADIKLTEEDRLAIDQAFFDLLSKTDATLSKYITASARRLGNEDSR